MTDTRSAGAAAPARRAARRAVRVPTPVRVAAWAGIVAPFVVLGVAVVTASWDWLAMRVSDDTYYYLEVGRRVADGQGSTFDGINETNGYHPVWQVVATVLAALVGGEQALVVAVLLVALVLVAVALVLAMRELATAFGEPVALGAGLAAGSGGMLVLWVDGMEGPATLVALAVVAVALRRALERWAADRAPLGSWVVVGACLGLLCLTRLDLAAVGWVVPVGVAVAARRAGRSWGDLARVTAATGAGAVAVLGSYLVWFVVRWGHLLTTSASVKGTWLSQFSDEQFGGRFSTGYARYVGGIARDLVEIFASRLSDGSDERLLLVVVPVVAGVALRRSSRAGRPAPSPDSPAPATAARPFERRDAARVAVVVVLALGLVKSAFDVVVMPPSAATWYAAGPFFVAALAAGGACAAGVVEVVRRDRRAGALVATLVVVGLAWTDPSPAFDAASTGPDPTHTLSIRDQGVDWILAEGPPGRYGAFDAGLVGYRLHDRFELVNLDGLVNDYDYLDLVVADAPLDEMVAHEEVDVVVNRLNDERLGHIADCGRVLWASDHEIVAWEGLNDHIESQPLVVVDVRACRDGGS